MNLNKLRQQFPQLVFEEHESLAPYTYMKVGGKAEALVDIKHKADVLAVSAFCFKEKIPFLVLGGGSNVIVPDSGLNRLVIHNLTGEVSFKVRNETLIEVKADSGVITAVLAAQTIAKDLTGLEYFVGVPGTIGGAIVNNSHFTSADLIGDSVVSVEVCTEEGKLEVWPEDKLKFDYDYSVFHTKPTVILSATFLLKRGERSMIDEHVKKAALKRVSTQPIGVPSSGCMYRNPILTEAEFQALSQVLEIPEAAYSLRRDGGYQVAAGFLIDRAGLKGAKEGDVSVSEKHATYMINTGHATAAQVEKLCQRVESTVRAKYGIELAREVFFLK